MSRQIQLSVGSRDDSQGKTEIRVVRPDRLEFEVSRAVYRLDLVRESVAPYGDDDDLTRPAAAARFLWRNVLYREPREVMAVVFLNIKNRAIGHMVAFTGTLSRTAVEPGPILAAALLRNAAAILVGHNHPSGDPTPSGDDRLFTRRLAQAGDIVGVRLADHLIVTAEDRWFSFHRTGGLGR